MSLAINQDNPQSRQGSVVDKAERRLVELLFLNSEISLYAMMVIGEDSGGYLLVRCPTFGLAYGWLQSAVFSLSGFSIFAAS